MVTMEMGWPEVDFSEGQEEVSCPPFPHFAFIFLTFSITHPETLGLAPDPGGTAGLRLFN